MGGIGGVSGGAIPPPAGGVNRVSERDIPSLPEGVRFAFIKRGVVYGFVETIFGQRMVEDKSGPRSLQDRARPYDFHLIGEDVDLLTLQTGITMTSSNYTTMEKIKNFVKEFFETLADLATGGFIPSPVSLFPSMLASRLKKETDSSVAKQPLLEADHEPLSSVGLPPVHDSRYGDDPDNVPLHQQYTSLDDEQRVAGTPPKKEPEGPGAVR